MQKGVESGETPCTRLSRLTLLPEQNNCDRILQNESDVATDETEKTASKGGFPVFG